MYKFDMRIRNSRTHFSESTVILNALEATWELSLKENGYSVEKVKRNSVYVYYRFITVRIGTDHIWYMNRWPPASHRIILSCLTQMSHVPDYFIFCGPDGDRDFSLVSVIYGIIHNAGMYEECPFIWALDHPCLWTDLAAKCGHSYLCCIAVSFVKVLLLIRSLWSGFL
jgi:hypothetical protein